MRRILWCAFLLAALPSAGCGGVPSDGSLLLWLPLDEGSGVLSSDASKNGIEAELANVEWATGAFGVAAHLAGTNASIEIPPVPGLDGAREFTVSLWATWEGTGRYPNLLTTRTWSPGGFMFFVKDESCTFRMGRPGHRAGLPGSDWAEVGVSFLGPLPRRQWVHLCAVFRLPDITTYVDGRAAGKGTWHHPLGADGLRLGAWGGPVSHHGLLDEVRIYGRAFSAEEVARLAVDPSRATADYALVDESKLPRSLAGTFENRRAILEIDTQGRIASLRSKPSGRELLPGPHPLVSARMKDGRRLTARRASRQGDAVTFEFGGGKGAAVIEIGAREEFFSVSARSLSLPGVETLTFFEVPSVAAIHRGAMANMLSDDADGVCLRGYELPVEMSCGGNPASVRAWSTSARGLTGWRAGLAAGPKSAMPGMLRAMAKEAGVPVSPLGGPWSLGAGPNRGSYLFANLAHAATDDWIDLARRGGFTHIHLHGWWSTLGHYGIRTNLFPNGLADMKDAVARIHAAGLKAGIHTLTGCIDTRDPWVTPEASPHLIAAASYTLARPVSPTDTVIHVNERPSRDHDIVFTYSGRGNAIRIGSEIVQYSEIVDGPPYAFAKCQRGAFKTRPAAHAAGDRADYLQQRYLAFYPGPDSPLAGELADRIAAVFNACGLDQIYFDGSEGMMDRYGIDAMRHAIFRRLRGEVLVEASCHGAHNWWFHSRLGAWDHPVWAAKRFHDRHIAASSRYRASDLIEPQMGWWAPRGPTPQARGHSLDEMEYFAAKNLGLDSAMSVQGVDVSRRPLPRHVEDQMTLLGWYERLRLARYFDVRTLARVALPGDEFCLRQDREGAWRFTPVAMSDHRVTGPGDGSERWEVQNPFAAQPLSARIEALYSAEPYESTNRMRVADGGDLAAFRVSTAPESVKLALGAAPGDSRGGGSNLWLRAENRGNPSAGAWARASLGFAAPYRSLAGAGALGFWVKGDGKGALLNVQLGTPREYHRALSDHYVRLDFAGWRYVALLIRERDVAKMGERSWPYGGTHELYRNTLDMAHVSEINLYLNDLPPGQATEVVLSPIVALAILATEMKNPSLAAGGRTIALPVALKSGDFLELGFGGRCIHYNEKGDLLARVRSPSPAEWPVLKGGDNALEFACEPQAGTTARAEVTVRAAGEPFGAKRPSGEIGWEHLAREYEMARVIAGQDGDEDAWEVMVRPGERARLEIELIGAMRSPILTIRGKVTHFPVDLEAGQRLICRDGRRWVVLSADREKVGEGQLGQPPPRLEGGANRVGFSCAGPEGAQVKLVKVYE